MSLLSFFARNGPRVLIGGLVAGLALPPSLNPLRGHIPEMVVVLLFLSVLRVGPGSLLGPAREWPRVLGTVLFLQLALPLAVLAAGALFGLSRSPLALALTLATLAPAIVGSPNICAMLGVEPARSLRFLIVGTAVFPLTIIPVFWLSPHLADVSEVLMASLVLLLTLCATVAAALFVRRWVVPEATGAAMRRLDGLSAIALALFVIGLMPEIRETAVSDPVRVVFWLLAAFLVNWGAQVLAYEIVSRRSGHDAAIAAAIFAGNRNIALFLVALPEDVTGSIMVFIGCYQFPMYFTPVFLAWYSRRGAKNLSGNSREDDSG